MTALQRLQWFQRQSLALIGREANQRRGAAVGAAVRLSVAKAEKARRDAERAENQAARRAERARERARQNRTRRFAEEAHRAERRDRRAAAKTAQAAAVEASMKLKRSHVQGMDLARGIVRMNAYGAAKAIETLGRQQRSFVSIIRGLNGLTTLFFWGPKAEVRAARVIRRTHAFCA